MSASYKHLTAEQRCQIYALKTRGDSHPTIAKHLKVHRSTIDREVQRNQGQRGYRYKQAEARCQAKRRRSHGRAKKMTPEMIAVIEDKLTQEQWSPEQISGWLKRENRLSVSHERIYQHIWNDQQKGVLCLKHLRRRSKKYQKRINGRTSRGRIIGRVDISERPTIVDEKSRIGDWEIDTVVGLGHRSALVTAVERKTRLTRLYRVKRNTAEQVTTALIKSLTPLKENVLTLTFDNGKEFAYHQQVGIVLEASTYFAQPYHSWERGLNENTNGLVRQYFPKKTDFDTVTDEEIAEVERKLNNRPRKCLMFRTPQEAMRLAA